MKYNIPARPGSQAGVNRMPGTLNHQEPVIRPGAASVRSIYKELGRRQSDVGNSEHGGHVAAEPMGPDAPQPWLEL